MTKPRIEIAGRPIGTDAPPYIIADMSCNHLGSLDNALKLIDAAKWAGADAIKPQLYTPDELCKPGTIAGPGPWQGQDFYDIYTKYQTPRRWFPHLFKHAQDVGITIFSSVFSLEGVDYLKSLGCPAYKISSTEWNWTPLLEKVTATGKPVLISVPKFIYPAPPDSPIQMYNRPGYPVQMDDASMADIIQGLGYVHGFSSHIMDSRGMIMAVALGCSLIEAHIALDLRQGGPDVTFSWEPHRFRDMVDDCHMAWRAMRSQDAKGPSMVRDEKTGLRKVA